MAIKILRSERFWWGASLALPPAVLGLPAASYAGMAAVDLLWRLLFGWESPAAVYLLGGLLYGLTFGVLLQYVLFGIAGYIVLQVSSLRLASMLRQAPRWTKIVLWIAAEAIVVPISSLMTMMAYGGPALLSWLFSLDK